MPAELTIGHTIPHGAAVTNVTLDGIQVPYRVRLTNRRREILVLAGAVSHCQLIVRASS